MCDDKMFCEVKFVRKFDCFGAKEERLSWRTFEGSGGHLAAALQTYLPVMRPAALMIEYTESLIVEENSIWS